MGIKLPFDQIKPSNTGKSEIGTSETLTVFQDSLLKEIGSAKTDWHPLALDRLVSSRREEIAADIRASISQVFGKNSTFLINGSTDTRLFPLFLEALSETNIQVIPVLFICSPLDACLAVEQVDQIHRGESVMLWLRQMLEAEQTTRTLDRLVISQSQLKTNWQSIYDLIIAKTGKTALYTAPEISPLMSHFQAQMERLSVRDQDALLLDPLLQDWARTTFEALSVLEAHPNSERAFIQLDEVFAQFSQACPIVEKMKQAEINTKQALVGELERQRLEKAKAFDSAEAAKAALTQRSQEIYKLLQRFKTLDQRAARYEELAEANKKQVDALLRSTSWQATRPVRVAVRTIRSIAKWSGGGVRSGYQEITGPIIPAQDPREHYVRWIERNDPLWDEDLWLMKEAAQALTYRPLISIIMPVYNTPLDMLRAAIESVLAQTYDHWELCIADDCSPKKAVRDALKKYQMIDSRIKVVFREENGHISKASNSALEIASGEWITLLDHDDVLTPHALYCVVETMIRHPQALLFYSDEDKIDVDGRRLDPYFKCNYNYDLFLAQNMICHLGVYKKDRIDAIGGFRAGFEGAQDYDLALRFVEDLDRDQIVHIPRVLYHWRVHEQSTASSIDAKDYARPAALRALQEHLDRKKIKAKVIEAPDISVHQRILYDLDPDRAKVSIIIPTRNYVDLLRTCIDSILTRTDYPDYEIIIVDNGSDDAEALAYLQDLTMRPNIRVLRDDSPFNFSALNNKAAAIATGHILTLLNNDTEVLNSDWLREMASHAQRPHVGCVGARLWYPDKTLQHGGVVLGIGGVAGHSHKHTPYGAPGYLGRAILASEFSAVTAACLTVRAEIYHEVGGLDESFTVALNDVDFCLRVREKGYSNVWTPYAELIHYESKTRGYEDDPKKLKRFNAEREKMKARWGKLLLNDPYYSPNLSLQSEDFRMAEVSRVIKYW